MAAISKLIPGQTVYSVRKHKGFLSRREIVLVKIIDVDPNFQYVVASSNNNPHRTYTAKDVSKWRVKIPSN